MAAPRKGPLLQLASRFDTGRGPGWSQAARQLSEAGYKPSWSAKGKIRDESLRDLYDKPRAGRLSDQERAARRKEIDAFVRSNRLNTRRLAPLSESQVSRQRAEPDVRRNLAIAGTTADSVGLGEWNVNISPRRGVTKTEIRAVMTRAWATFPGPGAENDLHQYFVRAHLELDYDKIPSTNDWYKYVEQASRMPERVTKTKDGRTLVRVILQLPTFRGEIESAARAANRGGRTRWPQRFAETLFGIDGVNRVLGFRIGPRGTTGYGEGVE